MYTYEIYSYICVLECDKYNLAVSDCITSQVLYSVYRTY